MVLLRPFESDATVLGTGRWFAGGEGIYTRTLFAGQYFIEQDFAAAVRPFGPLVAIGRPSEALPPPGAAPRFRETDQTWKDRVVDLLRRARLVILVPGTSEPLHWEITTAFQELKPQQLLIMVGSNTPREYEALSQIFKKATGRDFPDRWRLGRAEKTGITFDEGWTPRILRLRAPYWRRSSSPFASFADWHYGLEPVFRANGIEWHPLPLSKKDVMHIAWAVFIISLGIYFVLWPVGQFFYYGQLGSFGFDVAQAISP